MELTEQDAVATDASATPDSDASPEVSTTAGSAPPTSNKDIEKYLKSRAVASKRKIRTYFQEWKANVDLRIGKIASLYTGGMPEYQPDLQTTLNPDWSLTKTKTANLYSQVPTVRGTHQNAAYKDAVAPFLKQLNYEIGPKRMDIGVPMEEVLNDVVNAAGVGAIIVGYAARFEDVDLPVMDTLPGPNGPVSTASLPPEVLQQVVAAAAANGTPIPMRTVKRTVSDLLFGTRISPTDLLLPTEFMGSDYNKGPWVGRSGGLSWAEALNEFPKDPKTGMGIDESDKSNVCQTQEANPEDTLRADPEKSSLLDLQGVRFDELYYWRYKLDPTCKNFKEIWKIVFLHGKEEPVVHEPWKGQKYDEQTRKYVGSCYFPIQVLTLTYISDNPIPPSDSAAGRPQVNDLQRSRNQMFMNRERSTPLRWFDVNRIDPTIQDSLMRGTYQGFIPTNGDGSRTIGEIARASYPSEDLSFDQQTMQDLRETWQVGANQLGSSEGGRKTGTEANIEQQNFATRIGQERGRVSSFFLKLCEVTAGFMALYSDFTVLTPEEKQKMQQAWDNKAVLHDLVLNILPDSTVVLDSNARIAKLTSFLNLTAKSGFVNMKPIIEEMAALSGLDPAEVVVDPQPKKPDDPNISYRFTGKDDLTNPLVVAMLIHAGQAPTPDELKAAQQMLMAAQAGLQPEPPPGVPGGAPGAPSGPPPPGPGGAPGLHPNDIERPDHSMMDKVAKRSRDIGGTE